MSNFFGTDGIRGEVGTSPITADVLLKVGWAAGSVLREKVGNASVIIGKDTRVSGYLFESALEAGFLSAEDFHCFLLCFVDVYSITVSRLFAT